MIAWIKGLAMEVDGNEIILNVNDVGYQVIVGEHTLSKMACSVGEVAEFVIYTGVKEDEIKLYGFETFLDRKIFLMLLTVNGVGPKAALSIIDQMEPTQVLFAIQQNDSRPFLNVSGIGKKTAQRIIVDLQGKADQLIGENDFSSMNTVYQTSGDADFRDGNLLKDAISALSNLGFTPREAEKVVKKHLSPGMTLDEIIRKSLGELRK
jgi:holliday junction DNA helicase RuvA